MLEGLVALVIVAGLAAVIVGMVFALDRTTKPKELTPRERLELQLSEGEITEEQFYERDSLLRASEQTRKALKR